MSRIVVALGGNALGNTPNEQIKIVKETAKSMVDLVQNGDELIISHGNGPQVGMINNSFIEANKNNSKIPLMPFPECGAMSQAYIGFHLQNAILNELKRRNINKNVVTLITQVEVSVNDEAFKNPTKPIGSFYSESEAKKLSEESNLVFKEDSGRGWRRVIASPKPIRIIEQDIIKELIYSNCIVITIGGGGIPVIKTKDGFEGVAAVIDKDFASARLAEDVEADCLMILTAVEKVAINYGKNNEELLDELSIEQAKKYIQEGQFAPGSMLPKVEAAINFATSSSNRKSIIADLSNCKNALCGLSGTIVKIK
ncbi:carbamate kinase [Spiroplasma turonicum]|uniref:Carbamate kinase n=1 Tax=Spiroplasma turonicum TaxID=216946 RepID=A0A0K1P4S0_9MOLU|nr:carbamate kinase [Spiroplasma turonicum]AKU79305.1 carbamate kinase [Spiroplasma turonicum]ALX70328.1 carbamate kinase [Spiroplasma turonicum]